MGRTCRIPPGTPDRRGVRRMPRLSERNAHSVELVRARGGASRVRAARVVAGSVGSVAAMTSGRRGGRGVPDGARVPGHLAVDQATP